MTIQKLLIAVLCFIYFGAEAQVINFTPVAGTIIVSSNTTVGIGAGNFKTYLVCAGATLSYAESSTMDTLLLEAGATLKFDSAMSYGYAFVYAKAGSTVDMNFRQTGKLFYESGATIVDSSVGPPSFFQGAALVNGINYLYTNLPGGTGCTPASTSETGHDTKQLVILQHSENELTVQLLHKEAKCEIQILNTAGQLCLSKSLSESSTTIDLRSLPQGVYIVRWQQQANRGSELFLRN
ncbi:MAG: T9SS type A sorting domain-containing protein [Chitinophagaceae bacterium]|nr:T9SS type A sorting domain-containing protein [Chitinophagaceae bacterium]